LHAPFLLSALLFLGVPCAYLLARHTKENLGNIFFAAVTMGVLFSFCFDFLAEINGAWGWNGGLLFGKVLGVVQVDVMVWFFLWVLHIILFYEHFLDRKHIKSAITERGGGTFALALFAVLCLVGVYHNNPELLFFSYAYLKLSALVSIPFVLVCILSPKLVRHVLPMSVYFFFVYITHEITALHLEQWNFPGQYVGWVSMLGVSFPVEELVFWIMLSSSIAATYYEVMFDNGTN
jgi:hypothetical protein